MIIWSSKLFMSDSIKEKNLKKFKKIKKKIEKPKAPSFRERMKHARGKMTKKQKILAITIPSALVVLVGGFAILVAVVNDGYELSPDGVNAYFGIN